MMVGVIVVVVTPTEVAARRGEEESPPVASDMAADVVPTVELSPPGVTVVVLLLDLLGLR